MAPEWPEHFQPEVVHEGFGGKLSSYTIALEAWRRGLTVTFLDAELRRYRVEDSNHTAVTFIRSRPHFTTVSAVRTANDKHRTAQLLREAGVPAPESVLLDTETMTPAKLRATADEIGYPVVLKPVDGSMGRGVFAGIRDAEELVDRFADLMSSVRPVNAVMEGHVKGDDYRILVYRNTVVGACLRLPASITGDGRSTVRDLIERKNAHRRLNPFLSKGLIKRDQEVDFFLSRIGYDYDSVPKDGEHIRLRSAANASAGGDVVDVTETLPPAIKEAAVAAVHAIPDLYCAGVDVLYDSTTEASEGRYAVLELNAHPQIGVNMYPTQGVGQDAPLRILDECFPGSARHRPAQSRSISLPRLRTLLTPLRQGSASSVTLMPLPDHRYPVRISCGFQPLESLSRLRENRLYRAARTAGVAGQIVLRDHETQAIVAGEEHTVGQFLQNAERILKTPRQDIAPWSGPVAPGFEILLQ